MNKKRTREEIIANLKMSETEEGRSGLVAEFLLKSSEVKKGKEGDK